MENIKSALGGTEAKSGTRNLMRAAMEEDKRQPRLTKLKVDNLSRAYTDLKRMNQFPPPGPASVGIIEAF